jgi:hypothetical protein
VGVVRGDVGRDAHVLYLLLLLLPEELHTAVQLRVLLQHQFDLLLILHGASV